MVEFFISSSALFHELHHFYLEGEKALNLGGKVMFEGEFEKGYA